MRLRVWQGLTVQAECLIPQVQDCLDLVEGWAALSLPNTCIPQLAQDDVPASPTHVAIPSSICLL